jgi:T-lymphoma invasion and metastasis-inducing protein 1
LSCLLDQYLEPLRLESFLSTAEMGAIFGNVREMVSVQRRFLRRLEAALESHPPLATLQHPRDFKVRPEPME